MPRRVRKHTRKAARKVRRGVRRGRTGMKARSPGSMGNTCTITETIEVANLNGNTGYQFVFDLASYPRAVALAEYFQEYSCKMVTQTYEPITPLGSAPTMAEIAAFGPARKADLYWIRNTDGIDLLTLNLATIQELGAHPIPFGSSTAKNVVAKYRPNLVEAYFTTPTTTSGVGSKRASKQRWLSTREASVSGLPPIDVTDWQGHWLFIDDPLNVPPGTGVLPTARCTTTVVWQFRRPYLEDSAPGTATPVLVHA